MSPNVRFYLIYVWELAPEAFFLFGGQGEFVPVEATMVQLDSFSTSTLHKL
jgi:hypothetical protein